MHAQWATGFHTGEFRLPGNQSLTLTNLESRHRTRVQQVLEQQGAGSQTERTTTVLRLNFLACVTLNPCSLAFAEAERYLPQLLDRPDAVIRTLGLTDEEILIRMTGCAGPYLSEIGQVARAVRRYNLYLGAHHAGKRLNKLYRQMLDEDGIPRELTPLLEAYAADRQPTERFGDFVVRRGDVAATIPGQNFHA
ncbi:hypothetical protein LJY25_15125 [Hymenobacter sp. BT175]|uniref:hypothetical protein n=1 Tax=Hymenobacter translucens TaxID=2886507 RepID=UPI001D0F3642|nr:hypothetical protein [Hymenobacter translucens]MCC2547782.1 hypothetical protein [Hymenobacter translucens]